MLYRYLSVLLSILMMNCESPNSSRDKVSKVQDSMQSGSSDSTQFEVSGSQKDLMKLAQKSGVYGDVSIALDFDTISGVYEYYDKWDEASKQFMDVNVFYFFGIINNDSALIKAAWPGNDLITGVYTFEDSIKILLKDQPYGYAAFDFTRKGYSSKLTRKTDWKQVRIVNASKSYLHKMPDATQKTEVYVVSEDIVKIIEKKSDWVLIEFNPITTPSKKYVGWISNKDLYPLDPATWD